MTTYIAISNPEVAPDAPITTSLMTRLRDNPLAIQEGDPTAPSISMAAIAQGGKGADGALVNGTTLTGAGWFDFSSITLTTAKTIPFISFLRAAGSSVISAALSAAWKAEVAPDGGTVTNQVNAAMLMHGVTQRSGSAGAIADASGVNRPWLARGWMTVGGYTVPGAAVHWGRGGGVMVLLVEGDLDMTGGTLDCSGEDGDNLGGGAGNSDGGGGGTLLVLVTGILTNGTYKANGGANLNGAGTGGTGGNIQLIASSYVGTQTTNVAGGSGGSPAAGLAVKTTMSRDVIRTMIQRFR